MFLGVFYVIRSRLKFFGGSECFLIHKIFFPCFLVAYRVGFQGLIPSMVFFVVYRVSPDSCVMEYVFPKHTEYLSQILSSISSNSDLPSIYWPYYLPSFSKTKKFIEYLFTSDLTEYLQVSDLPSFFVRKSVEFLQYKKLSSFFCETYRVSNFGNCQV